MIKPYTAGIIQTETILASTRDDLNKNLSRIEWLITVLGSGHSDFPTRLVAAPETMLTGAHYSQTCPAPGDVRDFIKNLTIEIPGPETERLGKRCKELNLYFVGCTYTVESRWPDRFFNTGFIIGPNGKVILKYQKANTTNHLVAIASAPADMWDEWTSEHGDRLEDFFPVVDTDIGKLGVCICFDRCFPEVGRAFAVQGCEVLINPTVWADPWMSSVDEMWQIQTRAHALNNNMFVIAPNAGAAVDTTNSYPRGCAPGNSMIVDYRGRVVGYAAHSGETIITAPINIAEQRMHRIENRWGNFLPALRNDLYAKIYEVPFWTKNRFLDHPPRNLDEAWEMQRQIVQSMLERKIFLPPDYVGPVPPGIDE